MNKMWSVVAFIVLAMNVVGATIQGKVTRVSDGDTVWVADVAGKHKIRLVKIDAPESDQPYGKESTKSLSRLVYGKEVEVEWTEKDRYGRILGIIYLKRDAGKVDVNLEMVKTGNAWHYSYHDKTQLYIDAEKEARSAKRGLWAAPDPINPYQWRRAKRGR